MTGHRDLGHRRYLLLSRVRASPVQERFQFRPIEAEIAEIVSEIATSASECALAFRA